MKFVLTDEVVGINLGGADFSRGPPGASGKQGTLDPWTMCFSGDVIGAE